MGEGETTWKMIEEGRNGRMVEMTAEAIAVDFKTRSVLQRVAACKCQIIIREILGRKGLPYELDWDV